MIGKPRRWLAIIGVSSLFVVIGVSSIFAGSIALQHADTDNRCQFYFRGEHLAAAGVTSFFDEK
jgi:hypothetical protein